MHIFAVSRSQDVRPFALVDALDATAAIEWIKGLDEIGELCVKGYWGSEHEDGYVAMPATKQQVADWTANNVQSIARDDRSISGARSIDVERRPGSSQFTMFIAEPDFNPTR